MKFTTEELKNEEWKQYRDTNREISNLGRVRFKHKPDEITIGFIYSKKYCNYLCINVPENGKYTKKFIHRLVSELFDNYFDSEMHVHHKDEDKHNNKISNLALISDSLHKSLHKSKELNPRYKGKMARFTQDGILVGITNGSKELDDLGFKNGNCYQVANNKIKHYKNLIFRYIKDSSNLIIGQRYNVNDFNAQPPQMILF